MFQYDQNSPISNTVYPINGTNLYNGLVPFNNTIGIGNNGYNQYSSNCYPYNMNYNIPKYNDGAPQYTNNISSYNMYNNQNMSYQDIIEQNNNNAKIIDYISKKMHINDNKSKNNTNNISYNMHNNQNMSYQDNIEEEKLLNMSYHINRYGIPLEYYANLNIARNAYIHKEITSKYPTSMSIEEFENISYELINEYNNTQIRSIKNLTDKMYNRETFGHMLRNMCANDPNYSPYIKGTNIDSIGYYSKDNPTGAYIDGASFKNGLIEVSLPDKFKSEYDKRRQLFYQTIMAQ